MKKAICICGSPNRNGSISKLLAETARGMADAGISVQTFYLGETNIGYCLGCNACRDNRRCLLHDDMDIVAEALIQADIVCIGSPSWWGDVTAQLKTLFDRSMPLCDTNTSGTLLPSGKIGISIAVRAGRSVQESVDVIDTIEHWFGHLGIRAVSQLHFEGIQAVDDLMHREDALRMAYRAGKEVMDYGNTRRVAFGLAVAAERDAAAMAELNLALIQEEGIEKTWTLPQLEKRMRRRLSGEYSGILAWVKGRIAGYFLYRSEVSRDGKAGFHLEQCYIKPEYRHLGLKDAALKRIIDVCFRDVEAVSIDVSNSCPVGKSFWARSACKPDKLGFSKQIPVFSDDDPLKIIGWEQKNTELKGWRSIFRRKNHETFL